MQLLMMAKRIARALRISPPPGSLELAVIVATVLPVSGVHAQQVFAGGYEAPRGDGSPLFEWTGSEATALERIEADTTLAQEGSTAAKFTVDPSDEGQTVNLGTDSTHKIDEGKSVERAEAFWDDPSFQKEGDEFIYHWWTRWENTTEYPELPSPVKTVPSWQIFTQFHQHEADGGFSPPVALDVKRDLDADHAGEWICLDLRNYTDGSAISYPFVRLERGKWHEFTLHVRWSANPSLGFVRVYYDGSAFPVVERVARTLIDGPVYLKQGLYRNHLEVPATVRHDGMTVQRASDSVFLLRATTPDGKKLVVPAVL